MFGERISLFRSPNFPPLAGGITVLPHSLPPPGSDHLTQGYTLQIDLSPRRSPADLTGPPPGLHQIQTISGTTWKRRCCLTPVSPIGPATPAQQHHLPTQSPPCNAAPLRHGHCPGQGPTPGFNPAAPPTFIESPGCRGTLCRNRPLAAPCFNEPLYTNFKHSEPCLADIRHPPAPPP